MKNDNMRERGGERETVLKAFISKTDTIHKLAR